MNIGVLGTGAVGRTIGTGLVRAGHSVMMGSRTPGKPTAVEWSRATGTDAATGSFADAARFGTLLFNCTAGIASLQALEQCDADDLRGKTLVDVANPLDFSRGMPPTLTVCNTDSLGEQIQRAYPATKVVKALNTVNSDVMVDPALVEGDHMLLTCGNDAGAKAEVSDLLARAFGWKPENIIDLGDITAARGTEAFLLLWVRLMGTLGTAHFNLRIAPPALVEQVIADAPSRAPL
jgi:hypothetical protein